MSTSEVQSIGSSSPLKEWLLLQRWPHNPKVFLRHQLWAGHVWSREMSYYMLNTTHSFHEQWWIMGSLRYQRPQVPLVTAGQSLYWWVAITGSDYDSLIQRIVWNCRVLTLSENSGLVSSRHFQAKREGGKKKGNKGKKSSPCFDFPPKTLWQASFQMISVRDWEKG